VLLAARSATALHRLLDTLPVFAGDDRIDRIFTLVPGSDFGVDALAAIEHAGARTLPWAEACRSSFDLILAASPKGELGLLHGTRVLLPHGAGFNKTVRGEGSSDSASGLDPAYLTPGDRALAAFHALAHPSQIGRLAALSPVAAEHAAVVGDPTLERILASRTHRDRYREALGTGARTLIALTSTWGPESLLRRRPTLAADLQAQLPVDGYQLALIVHPNERSRLGAFNLTESLAPALDAGLILPRPYQEWAAVLIAADAVVTDHGSTALYAAALDRPLIGAYDGGDELIPGSPMDDLLARSPRLRRSHPLRAGLEAALAAHRPGVARDCAGSAFAEQGRALERLQQELYRLLGTAPPAVTATARPLPVPTAPVRTPSAFAVRTRIESDRILTERFPVHADGPGHHLAAEHGVAGEPHARSAGILYRRADRSASAPHLSAWTATGWTAHILDEYPGCGTAAVIVSPSLCVARTRAGSLVSVRIDPCREDGRIVSTDPSAVLCAVHAWLSERPALPATVICSIGNRDFPTRLRPATVDEAEHTL